jgi:hypothetical protein
VVDLRWRPRNRTVSGFPCDAARGRERGDRGFEAGCQKPGSVWPYGACLAERARQPTQAADDDG